MIYNGKYTIQNNKNEHRTFEIKTQNENSSFAPGKRIVALLNGADNESDYQGFAFLLDDDSLKVWKKKTSSKTFQFYAYLIEVLICGKPNTRNLDLTHYKLFESRTCLRCNRTLTTPESIQAGYGPECIQHMK